MKTKKYKVNITQVLRFNETIEVEAEDEEEAMEKIEDMINLGDIDITDSGDIDSDIIINNIKE